MSGVIKGQSGTPVAQRTELGWILSGRFQHNVPQRNVVCLTTLTDIEEQLKLFWTIEEIPAQKTLTSEEVDCERHYQSTHKRLEDGRYEVRIPFKNDKPRDHYSLGNSINKAMSRLLYMERKFEKDKQLETDYKAFMNEYLKLGHMTPSNKDLPGIKFYLPHHAVYKHDSSTTKLRVVFDGSATTSSKVSLNELMVNGPQIQQELSTILLRWRKHKVAYSADIEKMYRQIRIAKEDQPYQTILWRNSPTDPVKEYNLTTVTYGTRSAPFLAVRTLKQLAIDDASKYPTGSQIVTTDFYVDDLLSGNDSYEEAQKAQIEIRNLLKGGGFKLRKWASNCEKLLKNIPREEQIKSTTELKINETIKALGIHWQPQSDCLQFKVNLPSKSEQIPTKRVVLSEVSKLYDPLGFLAPVIVEAKLIVQELWVLGLQWDETPPELLKKRWDNFREELPSIEHIRIPRWINYNKGCRQFELHGFCDASEKAYAAVIYARTISETGNITTNLLTAKTKVAPIKNRVSLPRLELCGAVLLAQLMQRVYEAMKIENVQIYAWTDSTIVLAWIQGQPNKWKTFVSNRVAQIKSVNITIQWNHVKTKDNPADYASRGITPANLQSLTKWWFGPEWLTEKNIPTTSRGEIQTTLETRTSNICLAATINKPSEPEWLTRFSNFRKTIRIVAYCKRFAQNVKVKANKRNTGILKKEELEEAEKIIIRSIQGSMFSQEIRELTKHGKLKQSSSLEKLNPFIDEHNILRVGGRLQNSHLNYDEKHPIIIPHTGHVTTLIINHAHHLTMHGGCSLTLSHIRQKYWIIRGQSAVKQQIHKCLTCYRYRTKASNQLMGALPTPRVTINRPFINSGVDYAGPITIKTSKGRSNKTQKAYIVIFICLATKAVHIEVASDLTAQAFIAAFKRFIGRRGNVENIYSDNATNFVLANKILLQNNKAAVQSYNSEIYEGITNMGTKWHFIPPASPHFGGLWEAGVKSIKFHLKRTIGEHNLTYEELSTVLIQIEACLNSRPLCPMTDDPEDLEVLTPGHFLIGGALLSTPSVNNQHRSINLLNRWELLNRLLQDFWRKWSNEYLLRLQQRPKWTKCSENINIGNIVLIRDNQLPPTRWALGRVIETHKGSDDLVRVVTIRTNKGTFKRPIHKICLLPIPDNEPKDRYTDDSQAGINLFANTCQTEMESHKSFIPDVTESTSESLISSHLKTTDLELHKSLCWELQQVKQKRRSKIKPVTGNYPNLVSAEKQLMAFQINRSRKRQNIQGEIKEKIRRVNESTMESPKPQSGFKPLSISQGLYLIIIAIFLAAVGAHPQDQNTIKVHPFENHPGIFFENIGEAKLISNEWNLVIYYDMYNYWQEFHGIQESVTRLEHLCTQIIERRELCELTITQLNHHLKKLETMNDLLHNQGNNITNSFRSRRSPFNIVGTLSNKLFGILDQDFAQHYEQQIEHIKNNEDHLLNLLKNQTSILEVTTNILRKSEETIQTQFKHIEHAILQESKNMKVTQAFTSLIAYTTLIIVNYEGTQSMLLDIIADIHEGRISPLLLTPTQLRQQLHQIQEHISSNLEIPGRNGQDLIQVYKLITAKMRMTRKYALFNLQIPLYNKDIYQLFKIIPVPTPYLNDFLFIEPSTDYLAITLHRDHFYQLSEQDFHACTNFENGKFICAQNYPIFTSSSNASKCEVDLLNHNNKISKFCKIKRVAPSNFWIQLHHGNEWIYVLTNQTTLNVVCNNKLNYITLSGDGVLKLRPDCTIKQTTMIINSRKTFSSNFTSSISPSMNISSLLSENSNELFKIKGEQLINSDMKQLSEIQDHIKNLKSQENLPNSLTKHDIHQFGISYLAIGLLLSGAVYLAYHRWKAHKEYRPEPSSVPVPVPAPRRKSTDFVINVNLPGEDDADSVKK